MKKKNIIALFLATVMLVSLVSCADPVAGGSGNVINPGAAPSEPVPVETEALTLDSMELPLPDSELSSVVTVAEIEEIIATAREICNADTTITLSDGSVLYCAKVSDLSSKNYGKASKEDTYKYRLYMENVPRAILDMMNSRFPETSVKVREFSPQVHYFFLDPVSDGFENAEDAYKNGVMADNDIHPDGTANVITYSYGSTIKVTSYAKDTGEETLLFPVSDDEAEFVGGSVFGEANFNDYKEFIKEYTGQDYYEYHKTFE